MSNKTIYVTIRIETKDEGASSVTYNTKDHAVEVSGIIYPGELGLLFRVFRAIKRFVP